MQIPVLSGIYADGNSDFRVSYPRNMVPIAQQHGISAGYLRPGDGIVEHGEGPGADRGGINWNGVCYRVMGAQLVSIDSGGNVTELGSVGSGGQVTLDYSFDRLAIASNGNLFYWDGSSLTQVTDADLGTVVDVLWVDGYFMTTDGTSIVVTELTDPTSVNPLKYGSSEADPDQVLGLLKLRNEPYALNRYTIEVFQNIGGDYFPFQRVDGAQIMRGVVGTYAAAVFMEQIAFVGGGRNEAPSIWMASNSSTEKLATREIDQILSGYTESQLATTVVESRVSDGQQYLYVHLPDQCLVLNGTASQELDAKAWFTLDSGSLTPTKYRGKNLVWCYDRWLCADPTTNKIGYFDSSLSSHYGDSIGWEVGTAIVYNQGRGAIFHSIELVCLTGNAAFGENPTIWTSYSVDGVTWSGERARTAGTQGQRNKRIAWLQQGFMRHWRIQKFRGTSACHMPIARLEAEVEPMNV